MAELQRQQTFSRPSAVDDMPPASERQVAAEKAARVASDAFNAAVDFLERVFIRASKNKYGARLTQWIDPDVTVREYVAARDSVISDVLQEGPVYKEGLAAKREYYKEQVSRFVPVVEEAARRYALDSIGAQTQRLFQLLVTTKPRVKELHRAARAVRATVDARHSITIRGRSYSVPSFILPTMTGDEAREATGESRSGGTVSTRLRRMFYMYVLKSGPVIAKEASLNPAEAEAYTNLLTLMAHPRGVDIVDAFAKSSEGGWNLTSELMSDTLTAIVKLQGDLVTDETLVWRFPPAISAGVASLGLRNRAGITQFALAWGASRKGKLDEALEIAGNSLLVLDLVGGPLGAAVSGILDFVVAAIGTAVSFLRDVEQDQAATATATAFAERSERLSQGSNKLGTVLQGFAAIAAGLAVPGAVSKILGRRTTQVVRLPTEQLGPRSTVPGSRVGTRGTEDDVMKVVDRAAGEKGNSIAARNVGGKYELATSPKAEVNKVGRRGTETPESEAPPTSSQSSRGSSGRGEVGKERGIEGQGGTRPRTPEEEFADFEKWRTEELGATGPLTSDKLVQMYRHGSRATVAKYLKQHLVKLAAADGVMTVGEMSMKVKPGTDLEKQVAAFVSRLEGAHSTPQAFGKKLPKGIRYSPDDALVILTDKPIHTFMDQPWKDAFNDIRKRGAKQATGQEVFDAVADSIRKTPGMSESEKASRIARLHDEMFTELGLVPGRPYDIPRIYNWREILALKAKGK